MKKFAFIFLLLTACTALDKEPACPYDSCRNRAGFMYSQNVYANSRPKSSVNTKFSKLSFSQGKDNYGIWKGYVQGQGPARLYLNIRSGGFVQESRYIGAVNLRKDAPISFHFKSYLPKLSNWNWEITSG